MLVKNIYTFIALFRPYKKVCKSNIAGIGKVFLNAEKWSGLLATLNTDCFKNKAGVSVKRCLCLLLHYQYIRIFVEARGITRRK